VVWGDDESCVFGVAQRGRFGVGGVGERSEPGGWGRPLQASSAVWKRSPAAVSCSAARRWRRAAVFVVAVAGRPAGGEENQRASAGGEDRGESEDEADGERHGERRGSALAI
jgi:hypothetical protein